MKFSDSSSLRFYKTYDEILQEGVFEPLFSKHFKSVLMSIGEHSKGKELCDTIFYHIKQPQTYGIENILPSLGQEEHFFEFIEKECPLINAISPKFEKLSNKLKDIELDAKKILASRSAAHAEILAKKLSKEESQNLISFYKASLLKVRFLIDLELMVKKHNLDRNQVLRYFNDYGDIEFRELVPENSDWIKNHEEKFQNFLANNQNREILEWYKECLKSVKFEKLSVKEQSLFFIESFLVFALTPDKSGNRRGAWKFLEKIFYLGRFYNIHLMPIKWIVDFQQTKSKKKTNLRIPEKMTTLAKKRYKSIQDGKNFFCFFTQEQINRAESGAVKGRKYIQLGSQKLPISEIQNPDSRAIDNLSPGSDFVSITIAEFHSILGALLKDKKPNTDEIVRTIARVLKKALEKKSVQHIPPKILEYIQKHFSELRQPYLFFLTSRIPQLPLCTIGDLQQWRLSSSKEVQELAQSILASLQEI